MIRTPRFDGARRGVAVRFVVSLALFSSLFPSVPVTAEELTPLLTQTIIGPDLALAEVQNYCEARVPGVPQVNDEAEWASLADQIRRDVLAKVVYRGAAQQWRDADFGVEWLEEIEGGPGYKIRKLRYEALPGLWIPALLYEPLKLEAKVPVVMNVNGHDGKGKAAPYKQMRCINQAKRGMLALNVEWLGMGQLRGPGYVHYQMNQLDLCGTSGLAPFYLSMKRGLDVLLAHEHADPARVAVAGLSGGGWQTIIISSLDTRVTLANPVAGYSSFRTRVRYLSDMGDSEQTPVDLASVADYAHLTALLAPRATLLTYNIKDDCCFASDHALPPLLDAARPVFKLYGKEDNLQFHVNHDPGTHNFEKDNRQALYKMFVAHSFDLRSEPDADELESEGEVKTAEQLAVELPEGNASFHSLARQLCSDLPHRGPLPAERENVAAWRSARIAGLTELLRAKTYDVKAERAGTEQREGLHVTYWKLHVGGDWTVPAVELTPESVNGTAILVADGGRQTAGEAAQRLLDSGQRVVAVDPFYFGESKISGRDFLFALLVSSVGDRPLGLQASQLAAIARWLDKQRELDPPALVAEGPRMSLVALCAAALEDTSVGNLTVDGCYGSLKEVIEQGGAVDKTPELFCFGLLEKFDVRDLALLVAPRKIEVRNPTERLRQELAGLKDWYHSLGTSYDPVP